MVKQVDLVHASGTDPDTKRPRISESTVSRIILDDDYLPRRDTLIALAQALRVEPKALVLFVFDLGDAPMPARTLHPRAAQVDRVLGPSSRLTDDDRTFLDTMIGRLIDPVEKSAGRRRAG